MHKSNDRARTRSLRDARRRKYTTTNLDVRALRRDLAR